MKTSSPAKEPKGLDGLPHCKIPGVVLEDEFAGKGRNSHGSPELMARLKRAEEELGWKTALLEANVNSSLDGILAVDNHGRKILENKRMIEIWNIPQNMAEELDDKNQLEWAASLTKNPDAFIQKIRHLNAHPEEIGHDEIELKDGRTLDRYSAPFLDSQGRHLGRICTFRDITPQKQVERELRESQALYHSLVEHLPAGIFRKDADGRYVLLNTWFCNLREKKAEEILSKTAAELAGIGTKENEVQLLNRGNDDHKEIMRSAKVIEATEEYRGTNGRSRHLHVIKTPVFGADGNVIGSQGIMMDITERKRAEDALAHEQYLLGALLDNSDDKIYFKDSESRFTRCSAGMARIFNVEKAADLIGKRDSDFFSEEHALKALGDEREIIRTGKPLTGHVEKETWPDGRVTWVLTTKMPLRDKAGKITGTFGISKDITDLKEAEAKLNQIHRQLMDASRQAGMAEVATSVLHNVGNVLNSANVSASLIAEKAKNSKLPNVGKAVALIRAQNDLGTFFANDPKGKQLPEYLESLAEHLMQEQQTIANEATSLVNNIVHIKEIVAMQQGYAKASGVMESLKITELAEDALRMNSGAVSRHNIKVIRKFAEVPEIVTDKHKVLQVLINLIRNAKYACDDSGRTDKQIILRVWNGDGRVKISVIDNGIGIPSENLTRIFNHGFTTRKDGHGFGLHSGALAAKELGGSLIAFSEGMGHGATFTLELPANDHTHEH